MSLIAELKRRNVFKVAAAYLALGWIVVQATATLAPVFHLPEATLPLVTWIGVIGFPFAVVFSWIYELTPEGIKRESEVDRSQSITHVTSKRLDYIIIGLMVVGIGMAVLQYFRPPAAPVVATSNVTVTPAAPVAEVVAPVPTAPAPEQAAAPPNNKSIAVLPFADMSQAKDQEYFSDGMSEELLNLLAKIPDLKVIARTSSFAFKGTNTPIAEIARQLNVAHVLEGSVRKSGDTVRITAQLIRAADSTHVWSATYDRPLDNIFAVQDEIAGEVVKGLEIAILGTMPRAKVMNADTYALLLRARHTSLLSTPEAYERALRLYREALKIDPDNAEGWNGLAHTLSHRANDGLASFEDGFVEARSAATRALSIEPDFAPAIGLLGRIAMFYEGDHKAAASQFERALALAPDDTDILYNAARLLVAMGRFESAQEVGQYLVRRDPLNPLGYFALALAYYYAGQLDEGLPALRTYRELAPGASSNQLTGEILLLKGAARDSLLEMMQEKSEINRLLGLSMAYYSLGKEAESLSALADLKAKHADVSPAYIATVHAYRGELDSAFEWLERATRQPDPGMSEIAVQPMLARAHSDPRWLPFLRKIGQTPEQLAAIKFEVKLPQQ